MRQDLTRAGEYARLLSSIGLNGCNINNVNADLDLLTTEHLREFARIAKAFQPWGIKLVPSSGGTPRVVTHKEGAYWHSWSPDGNTLFFTRPAGQSLNIYSISIDGQNEMAITSGTGVNDDPDISPDGKYLYFNSDRSGTMQIWRLHPDGTNAEQMTFDDRMNWTAHPSPDGKWLVFISYEKGVTGHPANQPVQLRLMSLRDRSVRVLTSLTGGAGTMNVPAWSPDSSHVAFVSYSPK